MTVSQLASGGKLFSSRYESWFGFGTCVVNLGSHHLRRGRSGTGNNWPQAWTTSPQGTPQCGGFPVAVPALADPRHSFVLRIASYCDSLCRRIQLTSTRVLRNQETLLHYRKKFASKLYSGDNSHPPPCSQYALELLHVACQYCDTGWSLQERMQPRNPPTQLYADSLPSNSSSLDIFDAINALR